MNKVSYNLQTKLQDDILPELTSVLILYSKPKYIWGHNMTNWYELKFSEMSKMFSNMQRGATRIWTHFWNQICYIQFILIIF